MSTVDSCLSKETVTKPGIFFGRGLGDSPPLFSSLPSNMKKVENLGEHFLSAIWLPHSQLWTIIRKGASLNQS